MNKAQGFTLLEMMMVVLVLGVVARMVVAVLPDDSPPSPVEVLLDAARWAAEQAQQEGRIYRMDLHPKKWQISALGYGDEGVKGPFPGTIWYPVYGTFASGELVNARLDMSSPQPVSIWFMPGGEMTATDILLEDNNGEQHRLSLSPVTLWEDK